MELAKVTSRGRMTIPKRIREAANLSKGNVVAFEIKGDLLRLRKVTRTRREDPGDLVEVLSEWDSPEDEEAFRDL